MSLPTSLLVWVPVEVLALLLVLLGFGVMLRVLRIGTVLGFVGVVVLGLVLSPFLKGIFAGFPFWIQVLIGGFVLITVLRGVATLLIGSRASDTMVGTLAADIVCLAVKVCWAPFRMMGRWLVRIR